MLNPPNLDQAPLQADLDILAQQEALLRFPAFDANTAWQLGSLLRARLLARSAGATVEIEVGGQLLFACATPGAKPTQPDWVRRKRNTVHRFARSTYAIGRELALHAQTLESAHQLSETDFAAHGGGFPLRLTDPALTAPVGSVVLSGLPQREDHNLVAAALAELLGIAIPILA
jgi:uncharacterized protein (UPF0303 family)